MSDKNRMKWVNTRSSFTLRFHEKEGLLPGVMRRGGRRVYSEANLLAVKLIDFNL